MKKLSRSEALEMFHHHEQQIERMANNHFKWYMTHLYLLAFTITIYSFIFDFMGGHHFLAVVIFILVGIVINILSAIVFYNSWRYLKIERAFRKMQKNVFANRKAPPYNRHDYKVKNKFNFVFWSEILFAVAILVSAIIFPLIGLPEF